MTGNRKAALVLGALVIAVAAVYFLTPATALAAAGDESDGVTDTAAKAANRQLSKTIQQIASRALQLRNRVFGTQASAEQDRAQTAGYTELAT